MVLTAGSQIGCIFLVPLRIKISAHTKITKLTKRDNGHPAIIKKETRLWGNSTFGIIQNNKQMKKITFSRNATFCKNKNPFIKS